jgi:hypothetical protein
MFGLIASHETRWRNAAISQVKTMQKDMTRSRLVQVWFAAVLLVVVAGMALGISMTVSTGAMLLALSLVPPAIVLLLWPGVQPLTASQVLHEASRRDRS